MLVAKALLPSSLASCSGTGNAQRVFRKTEAVWVSLAEVALQVEGSLKGFFPGRGLLWRGFRRGGCQDSSDVWVPTTGA